MTRGPDQWEVTISDRLGTQRFDGQQREVFNRLRGQEPVVARFDLLLAVLLPAGLMLSAWALWSARRPLSRAATG